MEIALAVSNGIDMICRCNFTNDYITDETFECDEVNPDLIIINGRIISTNNRDSSDLLGDLEEWVSSGPTVVVQGKELQVVSSETSSDTSSGDDKLNSSGKEEEDSSDDDKVSNSGKEQEDSNDDKENSNGKEEEGNSGKEREDSSDKELEESKLSGVIVGAVVPVIILLLLISAVMSAMILFRHRIKRNVCAYCTQLKLESYNYILIIIIIQ